MRYQIANWSAYNPRADYKRLPWYRMQASIMHERKLHGLGPDQKWLWPCILGEAAEQNEDGFVELDVDFLAHSSGVPLERVVATIEHLVRKGLILLPSETQDVRETNGSDQIAKEPVLVEKEDVRETNGSDQIAKEPVLVEKEDVRDTNGSVRDPNASDRKTSLTKRNGTEREFPLKPPLEGGPPESGVDPPGSDFDDWPEDVLSSLPADAPDPPELESSADDAPTADAGDDLPTRPRDCKAVAFAAAAECFRWAESPPPVPDGVRGEEATWRWLHAAIVDERLSVNARRCLVARYPAGWRRFAQAYAAATNRSWFRKELRDEFESLLKAPLVAGRKRGADRRSASGEALP